LTVQLSPDLGYDRIMPTPSKSLEGKRIRLLSTTLSIAVVPGSEGLVTGVKDDTIYVLFDNSDVNTALVWSAGDRWNILSR
jgi:hypothetical protein